LGGIGQMPKKREPFCRAYIPYFPSGPLGKVSFVQLEARYRLSELYRVLSQFCEPADENLRL
jgi:hypothetical protein